MITHTITINACADLEEGGGVELGGPDPLPWQNLNFFKLHFKITKNMPRSPWQTQITIAIRSLSWLYEIKFFKKKK